MNFLSDWWKQKPTAAPWHELASSDLVKQAIKSVPDFASQVRELAGSAITRTASLRSAQTPKPPTGAAEQPQRLTLMHECLSPLPHLLLRLSVGTISHLCHDDIFDAGTLSVAYSSFLASVLTRRANHFVPHATPCPAPSQKYSGFPKQQISSISAPSRCRTEGRCATSRTRGGMRWTRTVHLT